MAGRSPTDATSSKTLAALVKELRTSLKHHSKLGDVSRALAAADLSASASQHAGSLAPLQEAVRAAPADSSARYALAEAQISLGLHADAMENALHIVKQEPAWNGGAAKQLLLKIFETLGAGHALTLDGRKRLSKLLFR